jgi:2,4-dienoyl-CoA reductase-like NADH-dependent reductase (Old Yellow Enzyme family)
MTATDPLLQPFTLKHLTFKNRVMSTGHEPAYAEDGLPKLRYQLYQEEKARGGVALTTFGGSATIAPDSPSVFGQINAGSDAVIPYFQEMAGRIHRHGAAAMCQITHMGRRTVWDADHWLPTIAPSPVREPAHRAIPKEMEIADIRRVVQAYAAAARRCQLGGLDGVEISSYGHLFDSFWTPLVNHRLDRYGGSLDNRLRFSLEVLAEIRKLVGDEFVVGIRLSGDEDVPGGLGRPEMTEIIRRLAATGLLDYINLVKGSIFTDELLSHVIPNMGTPGAPHLPLAAALREEIDLPLFHAGRIADVATARHAVAAGLVDMVGMTRALMADPYLVAKVAAGQEDQIRPCVGMGYCIDRIYVGREALCIHNPATGREESMPHILAPAAGAPRRVVVVGAGPAGLEAARVSAARGHQVVVLEANARPGGQLRLASRVPRRADIIGIVDWLYGQVQRLGVDVRLNRYAQAADVLAERPDAVIVATGGQPEPGFLSEGADLAVSAWEVLSGAVRPAGDVLFFDDHGSHEGYSCAELIAEGGARLEFVTPDRAVAQELGATNFPAYLKSFYERGVTLTLNHRLTAVRRQGNKRLAVLYNEYTKTSVERTVDLVVYEAGSLPVADVYFDLKERSSNLGEVDIEALIAGQPQALKPNPEGAFQLFRVGDAVASRNIHAAIYDALRLCKDL